MEILNQQKSFKELLKFPCTVDLRVIILSEPKDGFNQVCTAITKLVPNFKPKMLGSPRASRTGKYQSYTIPVEVADADTLNQLYRELPKLPVVKHVL